MFFFFKQKTAYEMRISDWSSDVCSSDLVRYLERGVFSGRNDIRPEPPRFAGRDRVGGDRQLAAIGHGIARVDGEVDDHLLKLPRIGAHCAKAAPMLHRQGHPFPEQPLARKSVVTGKSVHGSVELGG